MTQPTTEPRGGPVFDRLTEVERKVLACIAKGLSNNQIAAFLRMSPSTVKAHVRSVFVKINASNRVMASNLALTEGLPIRELIGNELPAPQTKSGRPVLQRDDAFDYYSLNLAASDAEWAKAQPGGLSAMVRDLLAWERWLREGEHVSLAAVKTLAAEGFRRDLSREEQQRLCGAVLAYAGEVCTGEEGGE